MKKGFSLLSILITIGVIVFGGVYFYRSNTPKLDPAESCQAYQDDVCALFDCMVDLCWCNSPILFETYISFNNEQGAKDVVSAHITELMYSNDKFISEEAKKMQITNVIKLNDTFYNVFVDKDGNEEVFTVSSDGKIITTICGV